MMTAGRAGHGQLQPSWAPDPALAAVFLAISLPAVLAVAETFTRTSSSMLDLRVYLWGGAFVDHGQNPYPHIFRHFLFFTYTPFAAAVFALLVPLNLMVTRWLITAASVAALVTVVWLTWGSLGYARTQARVGWTLGAAAVVLWIEPVRQTLSYGQVNLLLMLLIVADLCMPDSRWWKGVGIGIAAGFKLTPLIFIPYLILTRRFRAAGVATATFAVTGLGSALLMPQATHDYWLNGLFLTPNRIGSVSYIGNQSMYGAIARLAGSTTAARPYQFAAVAVVGTAGLLLAAWASRRGQEMVGILTCALTGLLVSPISWTHHWVWIAPLMVVLAHFAMRPLALPSARRWRLTCWLGIAALAAIFSGVLWLEPASALPGDVMTGFEQLLGDIYVLAGLAGLAVIAGVLSYAQRRDRRAPATIPVAASEQRLAQPG
ncbi:MAG TPA: glycosyltransferase 87 family protein [Streptosporangiaceae bacterium]|jgi:alpha-1,2-mannosyltransferase|nr:glycosyltransferase 87 family protein [Streptosporangiaceae bacterium]